MRTASPAHLTHGKSTSARIDQVRKNWSALLASIPDLHAEIVRSAVNRDTAFIEIHWTGTKADGTPFEERGVIIMGIRDDRIAWGPSLRRRSPA